jgi:competence protein ComEC
MNALIGKTPFFRLLLPDFRYHCRSDFSRNSIRIVTDSLAGLSLMLLSFFIVPTINSGSDGVRSRCLLFLFSLSLYQFRQHIESAELSPPDYGQYNLGVVLDIPEVKHGVLRLM